VLLKEDVYIGVNNHVIQTV